MEIFNDVLNLGMHPFADSFIGKNDTTEPLIPLVVQKNFETGLLKLKHDTSKLDRYNFVDYSYTSNNSATAKNHWDEFASFVNNQISPGSKVVEVGSNDGRLLHRLSKSGHTVLGVDASAYMCELAMKIGVNCLNSYLNEITADQVKGSFGEVDIVIANNVLNHANDVISFLNSAKKMLNDGGILVYEVPSWYEMVKNYDFPDMVYHEHVYYFTLRAIVNLAERVDMNICGFDIVNYHGGSFRITMQKRMGIRTNKSLVALESYLKDEAGHGIFSPDYYDYYYERLIENRRKWLLGFYEKISSNKYDAVVGVGAAAKANTWLNWMGLSSRDFSFITDASAHKQGKYTPLSRIPIVADDMLQKYSKPLVIVLSWNLRKQLEKVILEHNINSEFY